MTTAAAEIVGGEAVPATSARWDALLAHARRLEQAAIEHEERARALRARMTALLVELAEVTS